MIEFINISKEEPYKFFVKKYNQARLNSQRPINALSVSSYDKNKLEISSRYVNLKYIINNKFIFFSNYNSPKAKDFLLHNQIAASLYWPSVDIQIRMKAKIKRTSNRYNQKYFFERSKEKNALAISSNQSRQIDSYNQVIKNYNKVLESEDLKTCPKYWGGFSFVPYEIEFWEGNERRLNKRNLYLKEKNTWKHFILEP